MRRGQVHKAVVGDYSDGKMHGHQDGHRFTWLTFGQDVQIGQPQDKGDCYSHTKEHPARMVRDSRDRGPRRAGDQDADDRQLAIVRELEMNVSLGRREDCRSDRHEASVSGERKPESQHGGGHNPEDGGLSMPRGEVQATDP